MVAMRSKPVAGSDPSRGASTVLTVSPVSSVSLVFLGLLVMAGGACSASAAIERRSGPDIVGVIDAADTHRLYVTSDEGPRFALQHDDIVAIDHPGRRSMIVGGILDGVGLGFLGLAFIVPNNCPPDAVDCLGRSGAAAIAGITALAVGLPIWIRGLAVNRWSRAAAEPVLPSGLPDPL